MKPLLLFDVDGTIANSAENINSEIYDLLVKLSANYDLGIVGGGKHSKIMEQINNSTIFTHIFSECGCVYYKKVDENYQLIYQKNIRRHTLYNKINQLIKTSLKFLSEVDYTLTGNFIDLRSGIIYISLIGMVATQEERQYFININKNNGIRQNLINQLTQKAIQLGINNHVKILEGGAVGIAIYPNEYDKVQVIEHLDQYNNISYFGDKYTKEGNDYELLNHPLVIGYPVNSLNDTINILKKLSEIY